MKFKVYTLKLENRTYKLYDVINVPEQLRFVDCHGRTKVVLANATGFSFLAKLFKILAISMKENNIIRIKDQSKTYEKFHEWYENGSFHKDLILFNYHKTQVSSKKIKRLLEMIKYRKSKIVEIRVAELEFDASHYWNLKGSLNVNGFKQLISVSSTRYGFLYMAYEASLYHDIEDDENEHFHHSHLSLMSKSEDKFDMKYYYEK